MHLFTIINHCNTEKRKCNKYNLQNIIYLYLLILFIYINTIIYCHTHTVNEIFKSKKRRGRREERER